MTSQINYKKLNCFELLFEFTKEYKCSFEFLKWFTYKYFKNALGIRPNCIKRLLIITSIINEDIPNELLKMVKIDETPLFFFIQLVMKNEVEMIDNPMFDMNVLTKVLAGYVIDL